MLPREAIKRLLRPFIRLLVRHSVAFPEFVSISKALFVEAAERDFQRAATKASVSRISATTGLNRRDITHIRKNAGAPAYIGSSVLSRVITTWETDCRFVGPKGLPRALSCKGENSEFYALIAATSKDLHAGTILFALERARIVTVKKDHVQLLAREARLPGDAEDGFELLGEDIESLILTAEQNILGGRDSRNLHLRTEFDNISQSSLAEIRSWLLERGKLFHHEVRTFLAARDLDLSTGPDHGSGGAKVVLTSFGFTESARPPAGPTVGAKPKVSHKPK